MPPKLLIYDGECPMCLRARDWIQARAEPGSIELMPCQSESRPKRAPQVDHEQCMRAMQLVEPDGRVHSGAYALPGVLRELPGYRWLGALLSIPGVVPMLSPIYALVARNRLALSGFFTKHDEGERCSIDEGCR